MISHYFIRPPSGARIYCRPWRRDLRKCDTSHPLRIGQHHRCSLVGLGFPQRNQCLLGIGAHGDLGDIDMTVRDSLLLCIPHNGGILEVAVSQPVLADAVIVCAA